jgi:hypothetical protein
MKIGILLTGVSYGYNVGHEKADRDWNLTKDNLKTNLIDCFKDTDEVSVYLTTYKHSTNQEVFDFYQPKKMLLLDYEGSRQRPTYAEGLKNVLNEDLDFIITTRFDIHFNDKVSNYNFDRSKINFLFRDIEPWWSQRGCTGDCLHAFPKKYLQDVINTIEFSERVDAHGMHEIYKFLVQIHGPDVAHFVHEGQHSSNDNKFYDLIRAKNPIIES